MALLHRRGFYQVLERLQGAESAGEAVGGLDLTKAYDSVEYWALEDANEGPVHPE